MNEDQHPRSLPETATASAIEELRSLLLGAERQRMKLIEERIEERVENPEQRRGILAHDLPDAVAASDPEQLALALRESVERTLHQSVREDSEPFVDAIYPVIGQSVRRSIAEALRALVSNLNRMIEQGTSPRAIGWRIQAWRSGMPYSEVVLRHTLLYQVEQAFLIHRHTGLMIQHVERPDAPPRDSDAVSGMLTAIQDFVKDSFGTGDGLDSVEIGESTLWIINGPLALLACVVRGTAPATLHDDMSEALEAIHRHHGPALRAFNGNPETLEKARPVLEALLREETRPPRSKRFWEYWPQALLVTGLVLALAFWAHHEWERFHLQRGYLAELRHEEGIVALASEWRRGTLHVRGLRDPMSADPLTIAARLGLEGRIQGEWLPYHSLAPEVVARRVEQLIEPHDGVVATLTDGVLRVEGVAPRGFAEKLELVLPAIAGVTRVDTSRLVARDDMLLQQARAMLDPPASVHLSVAEGHLEAWGSAPVAWVRGLPEALSIPGIDSLSASALGLDEEAEAERITVRIHGIEIPFEQAAQVHSDPNPRMQPIADDLLRLQQLTEALGQSLRIRVIGYTDAAGTFASNLALSRQRAEVVKALLVSSGVPSGLLTAQAGGLAPGTWQIPDERARHAVIRVQRSAVDSVRP